jgi:hypothetical protein
MASTTIPNKQPTKRSVTADTATAPTSLTRSFVLSAKVSEEINRRAEAEDRSASKIVDRTLAAAFGISL